MMFVPESSLTSDAGSLYFVDFSSNTLKIPHLKIAHLGGNLEVGNVDIQGYQDCPPQLFVVFFVLIIDLGSVLRSQDLFSRALVSYYES